MAQYFYLLDVNIQKAHSFNNVYTQLRKWSFWGDILTRVIRDHCMFTFKKEGKLEYWSDELVHDIIPPLWTHSIQLLENTMYESFLYYTQRNKAAIQVWCLEGKGERALVIELVWYKVVSTAAHQQRPVVLRQHLVVAVVLHLVVVVVVVHHLVVGHHHQSQQQ